MKYLSIFLLVLLTIVSCKKEKIVNLEQHQGFCEVITVDNYSCGNQVIEDSLRYDTISNTSFSLSSVDVTEDCLSFELSASGCDGSTWLVNVVDAQAIAYTNPISKDLKVEFKNNELCTAVFTKQYYFDLHPVQESTDTIINLNIVNGSTSVLYVY